MQVEYATPPVIPVAPRGRSRGLLISTIALAVAMLLGLTIGAFVVTGLQGDLDSTQQTLATTKANLGEAQDTIADTEAQLEDANAQATACAKAADILAKGANGYAALWNEVDDAADRWNFVFDFYLRGIMRRTNVSNATLNAGWDAHDACQSGSNSSIDSL